MATACLFVLLLSLSAAVLPPAHARTLVAGDLILGGRRGLANFPPACKRNATADLADRFKLPEYPASQADSGGKWGPYPINYAALPPVKRRCSSAHWVATRMQAAIATMVAEGYNYCHHHAPEWTPPSQYQDACAPDAPDNADCACNSDGLTMRPRPLNGVDCSSYTSFLYNLAFGFYIASAIGQQACDPKLAPGRLLPYNVSQIDAGALQAGDLLFITPSGGAPPPVRVSHVIMWTNLTVDFAPGATGPLTAATLLSNVRESSRRSVQRDMDDARAAGRPVYVITDSTWTGPNYRAFAGWYRSSFSHARRVINPDPKLPVNDPAIAYYGGDGNDCMSMTALRG